LALFLLSNKDLICVIYLWLYEEFSNLKTKHPEIYTVIFSHNHFSYRYCIWTLILPMCNTYMAIWYKM
jgi:hypothetical protein